ncbi:MAG: 2'-5' RNA ligase family protein [Chloroflexales bacterium]|nr:2'-5' RNA ligase family protein [Chloroflexales bacterium]
MCRQDCHIRAIWHRLAALGLLVGGLAGYRPHITFAVYEDGYKALLVSLAAPTPMFPTRLDALGIFPEAGVLFLAPRMSQALFNLHRQVLHVFEALDKPSVITDLLLPDRWMPHCTLVGRLTPAQLLGVIEAGQRNWTPVQGDAVENGAD